LSTALEDRIHQPYRSPLCPLLPCLQPLKGKNGFLGAVLSGAGPSVLVFLDPRTNPKKAGEAVVARLLRYGLSAELFSTSITLRGARRSFRLSAK
jgi:homoserine kinase